MTKTVSKGWLYATVILGVALASMAWERHMTAAKLKDVFYYTCHVTVVDADSGDILHAKVKPPPPSSSDIFSRNIAMDERFDGSMMISGMGCTPRAWIFEFPGYIPEELTIGTTFPFATEIRIKMKRTATPQYNKDGQQAVPSDGHKPSSSVPTSGSTAPADAH